MKPREIMKHVKAVLTDDLLSPKMKKLRASNPFLSGSQSKMFGHCYVASEALYHLLGGTESGWTPMSFQMDDGVVHWWLVHPEHGILDPTVGQFLYDFEYYIQGRGRGFLTKNPSRRAQEVMRRVKERLNISP